MKKNVTYLELLNLDITSLVYYILKVFSNIRFVFDHSFYIYLNLKRCMTMLAVRGNHLSRLFNYNDMSTLSHHRVLYDSISIMLCNFFNSKRKKKVFGKTTNILLSVIVNNLFTPSSRG